MVELSGMSKERAAAFSKLETAMRFPVGSFSPLWMMYAGAASAGVAYWWMSRWAKPANLEAMFAGVAPAAGAPVALEPVLEPILEPAAEAVAETVEAVEAAVVDDAEIETEALEAAAFAPPWRWNRWSKRRLSRKPLRRSKPSNRSRRPSRRSPTKRSSTPLRRPSRSSSL